MYDRVFYSKYRILIIFLLSLVSLLVNTKLRRGNRQRGIIFSHVHKLMYKLERPVSSSHKYKL